jgi:peptide/nickel transport system substrate-binding protein
MIHDRPRPASGRAWIRFAALVVGASTVLAACAPAAPAAPTPKPAAPTAAPAQLPTPAPAAKAAASPVVAPKPAAAPAPAANRKDLRIRLGGDGASLDPAVASLQQDASVVQQLYSGLVRLKIGTNEFEPDLAERWEVSPDATVYTFHLRRGVKWHKGFGDFTSADVKYTVERNLNPDVKSRHLAVYSGIQSVETPDPYTVRITLKQPDGYFLYALAAYRSGYIVNQKAVEQAGAGYGRSPVGTGPFVFDHWTANTETVLTANDDYYGGPPKVARLVFRPIPEAATASVAFERGELDVYTTLEIENAKRFATNQNIQVVRANGAYTLNIGLNPKLNPALGDIKVRQALLYATNRQEIVDTVMGGYAKVATSPLMPHLQANTDVPAYPFDPARARTLLTEAGVSNLKVQMVGLRLLEWFDVMTAVQAQWKAAGIEMDLRPADAATWSATATKGEAEVVSIPTGARPEAQSFLDYWYGANSVSPTGFNIFGYTALTEPVLQAKTTADNARQRAGIAEAEKRLMTDLPVLPILYGDGMSAVRSNVKGYTMGLFYDEWLYPVTVE